MLTEYRAWNFAFTFSSTTGFQIVQHENVELMKDIVDGDIESITVNGIPKGF